MTHIYYQRCSSYELKEIKPAAVKTEQVSDEKTTNHQTIKQQRTDHTVY